MTAELSRRLFTVNEFYRMAEAGILGEDDRVELIEGEIVQMPPIGSLHASVVDRLIALLHQRLTIAQAIVHVQNPVRLEELSEPVPDISLLKPRPDFYARSHPNALDVLLIIEVSDTTLAYDRGAKQSLYARAGVAEFWIADVSSEAVEVYRQPSADGYRDRHIASRGESVSPLSLPDLTLTIDGIFG